LRRRASRPQLKRDPLGSTLADTCMLSDQQRKALLNTMFRVRGSEFNRCFAPPPFCPRPAIRAHSVQNARALDLLVEDGHIITPNLHLTAGAPPEIDWARVGRNRATTFSGLCEDHDREIFGPIEAGRLLLPNPEQQFLLAYRATFYEVHATCAAAWQIQTAYQKRVELGVDPPDQPSEAGLFATQRIVIAHDTFRYKEIFDDAYLRRDFGVLDHDWFLLDVRRPTGAACALFSLDHAHNGDDVVHVCLNILPLDAAQTLVQFSYTKPDATLARAELQNVLAASGDLQTYELSRRLLNSCQNFVLSPSYVSGWTPSKRKAILDYFVRTLLYDDFGHQNPDLLLFERAA
jgi:hypothetical protein